MIWLQGLACFALWVGYGIFKSRSSNDLRARLAKIPRQRKALAGAGYMILGAAILFAALMASHALGGFTPNGMTLPTWGIISITGLAFVHAQTMAMAMLVAMMIDGVVTSQPRPSSDQQGQDAAQP